MAILIDVNGEEKKVFPVDKKNGFTLEEIYSLIGCSVVEIAYVFASGEMILVDEEGLLKEGNFVNPAASLICGFYIYGNALKVSKEEFQ